jgi:hypothetical protein
MYLLRGFLSEVTCKSLVPSSQVSTSVIALDDSCKHKRNTSSSQDRPRRIAHANACASVGLSVLEKHSSYINK